MAKFLGESGLTYLWGKIKTWVSNYAKITSATGKDTITVGNSSFDVYDWAQASTKPSYTASEVGALASTDVGVANGVCPLDGNALIDSQYLPSYVDDVIEAYARTGQTALSSTWLATGSASGSVIVPTTGKIYVLMAATTDYPENTEFRWGGSAYVKINDGGISEMTTSEMDTATNNWA